MANEQSPPSTGRIRVPSAIRRVIELRFGLAFLATIASWAALTRFAPPALIANAMRLETYLQFTVVATVNLLAATFAVSLLRVLFKRYPPEHEWSAWIRWLIGNGDDPWKGKQVAVVLFAMLPTPVVLLSQYGSEFSGIVQPSAEPFSVSTRLALGALAIPLSGALAYAFLLGPGRLKTWLFGSEKDTRNFLPFEAVDSEGVILSRIPRMLARWLPFEAIDYQLGAYSVLLAATHFGATRLFASHLPLVATAPLVIVLILWIGGMLLTGLAYWLDKIRVPVFVALLVAMLAFNIFMDRDYSLKPVSITPITKFTSQVHAIVESESNALLVNQDRATAFKEAAAPLEDAAWNAIASRMNRASAEKRQGKRVAVVVTCPGGGIHAAAWSSHVLESLSKDYPRFRDSICVVSGVSGGSVGTLFFVSTNYASAILEDASFKPAKTGFELATESSLEQISVGLMTDDLYGAFFPLLSLLDRGQRLEDSFTTRLPAAMQNLTLNHWGKIAEKGEMPIVIFNATDAVTGRRILFDSLPHTGSKVQHLLDEQTVQLPRTAEQSG